MHRVVRVVGVGSPHGDDGVGWRLVESLAGSAGPGVEPVAVADPLGLLDHLENCDALIVVDACRAGRAPGTASVLIWPADRPEPSGSGSTHGLGLAVALELAERLSRLPRTVVLFAVEAGPCAPGSALSPELERDGPELGRRLREVVEGVRRGSGTRADASGVAAGIPGETKT